MNFIYNEAVDFIFALRRFGIRNRNLNPDYPSIPELDNWAKKYEKKLSPFLINDISILTSKTILIPLYLFNLIVKNPKINTPEDFIDLIKNTSAEIFSSHIISNFINLDLDDISVDNIYNTIINDGLHPGYDIREESELIYGFLQDPDNFIKRLYSTLVQFNNDVYLPSKDSFSELRLNKFKWHNSLLQKNNKEYCNAIGLNSLIKEYPNLDDINFYFSLFLDNDVFGLWDIKTIIVGGGTDTQIIQHSAKTKSDLLFNCLGDPKRLEIIRLTSQRPWYSTELATYFNLKPATLSYHLNILVEADLLTIKKGEVKRLYYTINKESLKDYLDYVSQDLLGLLSNE